MRVRVVLASVASVGAIALAASCSDPKPDLFVARYDGGAPSDAAKDVDGETVDPTLGGPCVDDTQCNDGVDCTYDRCDKAILRCRNVPDDAQCGNGVFCDGIEKCVPRLGCRPGPVTTCQDGDGCTIDRCVEADKSCVHAPRDADGDGVASGQCVAGGDCDDDDPQVSPKRTEVCGNGKDDDCDGLVDEQPCTVPVGDTCGSPVTVTASGALFVSTAAAKKDYATSCAVASPAAAVDVVVAIVVPPGGPKDVSIWASSEDTEVSVALQSTCGQLGTELHCDVAKAQKKARALGRSLAPGTYYAIVSSQIETQVDLRVDLLPPTTKPGNEDCASAQVVATDAPFPVSVVDAKKDLPASCTTSGRGELVYAFDLAAPQDVRIFASTVVGSGEPTITLRGAACDELRCRPKSTPSLFARSLAAGRYYVGVSGTTSLDANVLVKTYPPTAPPPNQTCAAPPPAPVNGRISVDLGNQEDAIQSGCMPGAPNAAYELVLAQPSDVLVVGRFPPNENGAVSLSGPACAKADLVACADSSLGGGFPARLAKRNLPAGTYRVVVAQENGKVADLSVFVRPTVAPVTVTADDCSSVPLVPASGGYFVGDTNAATPGLKAGCDAPGTAGNGANDQLLRLDLAQQSRVLLDMSGSGYTTILDVRQGATCPGVEVPDACYVGFGAARSFLERVLPAGTYWLQIDGYSTQSGPWGLDVRVLPP